MNKVWKIILLIGLILILLGAILFIAAFAISGGDLSSLSSVITEQKTYTEPAGVGINTLSVNFENSEIRVKFDSNAETLSLQYQLYCDRNGNPKNEVLIDQTGSSLEVSERMIWYRNLFQLWNFSDPEVTVILPANRNYTLTLKTSNGNILLEGDGVSLCKLTLKSNNGSIRTDQISLLCEEEIELCTDNGSITTGAFGAQGLVAQTNNGRITLGEGTVEELARIETDNGQIELKGKMQAGQAQIDSDNGKITVKEGITAQRITVTTNNGNITASGALDASEIILEIDNGDIRALIAGKRKDYTIEVEKDLGKSNIASQSGGSKHLRVENNIGDIEIDFSDQ